MRSTSFLNDVEVIRDTARWEALAPEWDELFALSPTAAPPLDREWLREWWRVYGPACAAGPRSLRICTVRQEGRLAGILPLYVGRAGGWPTSVRRLRFLSTGESEREELCATYLDLLHLPDAEGYCLDRLRAALLEAQGGDWDELDLSPVSCELALLHGWDGAPGLRFALERCCYVAEIDGGMDVYFQRLSRSTRKEFRQLLRAVETEGATFELADDAAGTDRFFDDLVRLHQERWQGAGKRGCFASPRFLEFHRSLARAWVPQGKAVLARLSLAGEPLALQLGFVVGNKFDAYVHAARMDCGTGALRSPGNAVQLLLMEALAARGIARYDHMMGPAGSYKERFTTDRHRMVTLHAVRPTLRAAVHQIGSVVGYTVRGGLVGSGRTTSARDVETVSAARQPVPRTRPEGAAVPSAEPVIQPAGSLSVAARRLA